MAYQKRSFTDDWLTELPDKLPPLLADWLQEKGSLTQRVQSICSPVTSFNLRVIKHHFELPHRDELSLLNVPGRVRTREVLLRNGSTALIFAHSIVSRADLAGAWACMDGIGDQSLGSVLFADPAVTRSELRFHCCNPNHPLYRKAVDYCAGPPSEPPSELWARRAVFLRDNRPLVVTEVFLPVLLTP